LCGFLKQAEEEKAGVRKKFRQFAAAAMAIGTLLPGPG
jgi:hypothetical protein